MNSLNDIWQSVLDSLAQKLTPTAMNTWFNDCTPVGLDGNCLVLHSPNEFKSNIIASRYGEIIKQVLSDIFSMDFDVQVLGGERRAASEPQKRLLRTLSAG